MRKMQSVRVEIKVNGELKRFFVTVANEKELERLEKVISNEINKHK